VSGATVRSDQFPSQTAISLYFTPSGSQGAGSITGSATQATVMSTTTSESTTAETTSMSESQSSQTAQSSHSTDTSTAGAAPTGVWVGVLGAIAGGAVVAVL
jgi:hypothetical protein